MMTVMIRIIWGWEEEEEEDRQLDSPKYSTSGKAGGEFLFGSLEGGADNEPRASHQLYERPISSPV
jgi:hypothetical protein